jgi:S-(hydroxymethyl)glutathione dehydrogenase / alcohol dehydrogenase
VKFRAAVLAELGKPLVLDELEVPRLRFGQVLVRIHVSGVCGAQLNEIDGAKGPDAFLPHLLGHEATATVEAIGEGVTTVKDDDLVVCHWRKGAGLQGPTPRYRGSTFGEVNAGWVTTFSEYAVVSENRATPVPADLNPEHGALLGCAVTTALGVLENDARLRIGESIAVFGTGGVGLSLVQFAARAGANPIVAIDLHSSKLELAEQLGATHTIDASSADVAKELQAIVGPNGVDVTVENTGVASVIETAYAASGPSGRTILVGVPPKRGPHPTLYTLPLHFDKVLTGSEGGGSRPDRDIPRLLGLIDAGKLDLAPLVSERFALDEVNDAVAAVREGRVAARCMIRMDA